MTSLCVVVGALHWVLAADAFTLAWTHSIEKIRWEEDYRVERRALVLTEARIRGSGAGMEPPANARFENGVWRYTPAATRVERLLLANSAHGGHYDICIDGRCHALPTGAGGDQPAVLAACAQEP